MIVERKPPIEDRFKPAERLCLKCGEWFMSEWAGNRRCRKCEQKVNQEYIPKQFTDFNTETSDE